MPTRTHSKAKPTGSKRNLQDTRQSTHKQEHATAGKCREQAAFTPRKCRRKRQSRTNYKQTKRKSRTTSEHKTSVPRTPRNSLKQEHNLHLGGIQKLCKDCDMKNRRHNANTGGSSNPPAAAQRLCANTAIKLAATLAP